MMDPLARQHVRNVTRAYSWKQTLSYLWKDIQAAFEAWFSDSGTEVKALLNTEGRRRMRDDESRRWQAEKVWKTKIHELPDERGHKDILHQLAHPTLTKQQLQEAGFDALAERIFGVNAHPSETTPLNFSLKIQLFFNTDVFFQRPSVLISKIFAALFFLLDICLIILQTMGNAVLNLLEWIFRFSAMKTIVEGQIESEKEKPLLYTEIFNPFIAISAAIVWIFVLAPHKLFSKETKNPGKKLLYALSSLGVGIVVYSAVRAIRTLYTLGRAWFLGKNKKREDFEPQFLKHKTPRDLIISWRPVHSIQESSQPYKSGVLTKVIKTILGLPVLLIRLSLSTLYKIVDFTSNDADSKLAIWSGLIGFVLLMLPLLFRLHFASGGPFILAAISFSLGGLLLIHAFTTGMQDSKKKENWLKRALMIFPWLFGIMIGRVSQNDPKDSLKRLSFSTLIFLTLVLLPSILGLPLPSIVNLMLIPLDTIAWLCYITAFFIGLFMLLSAMTILSEKFISPQTAWDEATQQKIKDTSIGCYMVKTADFMGSRDDQKKSAYLLTANVRLYDENKIYTVVQKVKNNQYQVSLPDQKKIGHVLKKTYEVQMMGENNYRVICTYHLDFMAQLRTGKTAITLQYEKNENQHFFRCIPADESENSVGEVDSTLGKYYEKNFNTVSKILEEFYPEDFRLLSEGNDIIEAAEVARRNFSRVYSRQEDTVIFSRPNYREPLVFQQRGKYFYRETTSKLGLADRLSEGERIQTDREYQEELQKKRNMDAYLAALKRVPDEIIDGIFGNISIIACGRTIKAIHKEIQGDRQENSYALFDQLVLGPAWHERYRNCPIKVVQAIKRAHQTLFDGPYGFPRAVEGIKKAILLEFLSIQKGSEATIQNNLGEKGPVVKARKKYTYDEISDEETNLLYEMPDNNEKEAKEHLASSRGSLVRLSQEIKGYIDAYQFDTAIKAIIDYRASGEKMGVSFCPVAQDEDNDIGTDEEKERREKLLHEKLVEALDLDDDFVGYPSWEEKKHLKEKNFAEVVRLQIDRLQPNSEKKQAVERIKYTIGTQQYKQANQLIDNMRPTCKDPKKLKKQGRQNSSTIFAGSQRLSPESLKSRLYQALSERCFGKLRSLRQYFKKEPVDLTLQLNAFIGVIKDDSPRHKQGDNFFNLAIFIHELIDRGACAEADTYLAEIQENKADPEKLRRIMLDLVERAGISDRQVASVVF